MTTESIARVVQRIRTEAYQTGFSHGYAKAVKELLELTGVEALKPENQENQSSNSTLHQKIIRLYTSGLSASRVAKQLDRSTYSVYEILKRAGVLRTRVEARRLRTSRIKLVLKAFDDGATCKQIQHKFGYTDVQSVYKLLYRHGRSVGQRENLNPEPTVNTNSASA